MGCRGELGVAASPSEVPELNALGGQLLDHLERKWSRFLPDSDISLINRAGVSQSRSIRRRSSCCRQMAVGVRLTGGAFDPTLLGAIAGLGYGPAWNRGQPCSPARCAACFLVGGRDGGRHDGVDRRGPGRGAARRRRNRQGAGRRHRGIRARGRRRSRRARLRWWRRPRDVTNRHRRRQPAPSGRHRRPHRDRQREASPRRGSPAPGPGPMAATSTT